MKIEDLSKPSGEALNKGKYLYVVIIGIAVIILVGAFIPLNGYQPISLPNSVSPILNSTTMVSTNQTTTNPVYYKKLLVFKRTISEEEYPSIRTSALSTGYMALSVIPSTVVVPQFSIRVPQFPQISTLNNYQALSTLGTPQYYSNLNVQQYLNNLSSQQYINDLSNQVFWNNFDNQQYVNNFNYMNSQQFLNNFNTYSNPTFIQPPQIYVPPTTFIQPPQIYVPPITFIQPPQIYIPPPSFNFP